MAKYISIGDNVQIAEYAWINIAEVRRYGQPAIILEDNCGIGSHGVISAKDQINVGRNARFAPAVLVTDYNHEFKDCTTPIKLRGTTPGEDRPHRRRKLDRTKSGGPR